jgi:hypothetical protein
MIDAEGPDLDTAAADERERLLNQIANALNIPVAAFGRRAAWAPEVGGPDASECAALLAAFSRITDPARRSACLAMVKRYSKPEDPGFSTVRPRTREL